MTKSELILALDSLRAAHKVESEKFAQLVRDLEIKRQQLEAQNRELWQIQQQLQSSRDRYAELYESSPVGYLGLDESGCIRVLNLAAAEILGIERQRLTGKSLAEFIEVSERARFDAHIVECRNGALQVKTELKLFSNNVLREIELLSVRPREGEGDTAFYRTAITDITHRNRAAQALRESEAKLRWLIDNMPAVLWTQDEQGGPRYVSANVAKVLGYTEQELRSGGARFWFSNVHPEDRHRVREAYARIFCSGEGTGPATYDIEYRRQSRDGSWIWVVDRGMSLSEEKGARYATGMFWDTSRRKRMQEQLRESEERFRQLAENINDVFFLTDVDGSRIFYVSPTFEKVWGFSSERLYRDPSSWQELIHEADRERVQRAMKVRKRDTPYDIEFRINQPGRAVRWIRLRGFPIRDGDGRVYRFAGIAIDVTARRTADESLQLSHQRMRELASHLQSVREDERKRIAREIHDELGALLLAIKIDLDVCCRRRAAALAPDIAGSLDEVIQRVDAAIESVRRIATDLRPSILDHVGVLAAVEWEAEDLKRRTGIQCEVIADPADGELDIDPERETAVFRIVQEALTNVIRHSAASEVKIALRQRPSGVEIEIRDNGRGFDPKLLAVDQNWGLAGMAERANALGGRFGIRSAPGRGTTVTALIPRNRPRPEARRTVKVTSDSRLPR